MLCHFFFNAQIYLPCLKEHFGMELEQFCPDIIVAAGFSNYYRKYPKYKETFGEDKATWTCYLDTVTIEEHLEEIKSKIPKDRPYLLSGHSMGGALLIELMKREKLENCKGIILVGASQRIYPHWFLNFTFYTPVFVIYAFAITLVLSYPLILLITGFNTHKAKQAAFEGLERLLENGARRMKAEYNQCLRKVGKNTNPIVEENKAIPVLFIRLKKDMMVKEEDVSRTKKLFEVYKERIIPTDSVHLTHDFDDDVAKMIKEEYPFFGYSASKC